MANETCFSFSVEPGTYRVISGVNLDDEDFLDLWRLACPAIDCADSTELWIPYRPNCELISLTTTCNPLVVSTPGRYRLNFRGLTNTAVTVCVGDPYPITQHATINGV